MGGFAGITRDGPIEDIMGAADSINVTDLINQRPVSRYQISVFFLCALTALMDGHDSVIIGITAPAIAASLGLDVKTFGPVFSAAQFGFMIGAFAAGPLADRFGRKSLLTQSFAIFGLFGLLTPLSGSYEYLVIFRFLTGIGLGGASVTFVSLPTEYAPLRIRATIVTLMWIMLPLGNVDERPIAFVTDIAFSCGFSCPLLSRLGCAMCRSR